MQAALQFQSTASVFQLTFTHSLADSFILCAPGVPFSLSLAPSRRLRRSLSLSPSRVRLLLSLTVRMTFTSLSFAKSFFSSRVSFCRRAGLPPRAAVPPPRKKRHGKSRVHIHIRRIHDIHKIAWGSLRGGDFVVVYKESAPIPERLPGGAVSMAAVPAVDYSGCHSVA